MHLESFTQDLRESLDIPEDVQSFLVGLIQPSQDLEVVHHLDQFFTRIFKDDLAGISHSVLLTRYCANTRNIIDQYFITHFDELLKK